MTDTPLIRRQTTADRGVKAVTTHDVLACIKELTSDTFSTRELANALMVMLDSLKGIVFEDDKFVHELHGRRAEPDGDGRLVVTISPMLVDSPQPSLI